MRAIRGFTLVELLIAMALGTVIVVAAVAGLRVASQAVTVSTRLSRENALMRAGVSRAHDEIDFWTTYDDPTLADSQRPLKKKPSGRQGLPFQRFSETFVQGGSTPPTGTTSALTDSDESATGWDGTYAAFAVANPRSWLRSNLIEKDISDGRFGRYAIFANTADSLTTANFYAFPQPTVNGSTPPALGYGPVSPTRHWMYRQIDGLAAALGYFGMLEYLPANTLYEFYGPTRYQDPRVTKLPDPAPKATDPTYNDYVAQQATLWTWTHETNDAITNAGGIPQWCIHPGNGWFNNSDGGQRTARGKYRNSYMTSYGLMDPASPDILGDQAKLWTFSRNQWVLGYDFTHTPNASAQTDFNRKTAVPYDLIPIHPSAWPDLTVSVQRLIKNARHVQVCRVRWVSPITGDNAELSFATFGTSLRGARQQRRPDGGWAKWDDDGADHSADTAFKTLDSY